MITVVTSESLFSLSTKEALDADGLNNPENRTFVSACFWFPESFIATICKIFHIISRNFSDFDWANEMDRCEDKRRASPLSSEQSGPICRPHRPLIYLRVSGKQWNPMHEERTKRGSLEVHGESRWSPLIRNHSQTFSSITGFLAWCRFAYSILSSRPSLVQRNWLIVNYGADFETRSPDWWYTDLFWKTRGVKMTSTGRLGYDSWSHRCYSLSLVILVREFIWKVSQAFIRSDPDLLHDDTHHSFAHLAITWLPVRNPNLSDEWYGTTRWQDDCWHWISRKSYVGRFHFLRKVVGPLMDSNNLHIQISGMVYSSYKTWFVEGDLCRGHIAPLL